MPHIGPRSAPISEIRDKAADEYFTVVSDEGGNFTYEGGRPLGPSWETADQANEICSELRHAFVMGALWADNQRDATAGL